MQAVLFLPVVLESGRYGSLAGFSGSVLRATDRVRTAQLQHATHDLGSPN